MFAPSTMAKTACASWLLVVASAISAQEPEKKAASEVTLIVRLPASASLTVAGVATKQKGEVRRFSAPSPKPGHYTYELQATWEDGGKPISRHAQVMIPAGLTVDVDLKASPIVTKVLPSGPETPEPAAAKPEPKRPPVAAVKPAPKPAAVAKPKVEVKPVAKTEPVVVKPAQKPEPVVAQPEQAADVKPAAAPEPVVSKPETVPEPKVEAKPERKVEVKAEPSAAPPVAPKPEPERVIEKPTPAPMPEPVARQSASAPEPKVERATESIPPKAEPKSVTISEAKADAKPAPQPPVPPEHVAAKPVPSPEPTEPALVLRMPSTISLAGGQSTRVPVRVKRTACDGDIVLHFDGTPAGLSIPDVTIPAGKDEGEVVFNLAADAAGGEKECAVVCTVGKLRCDFALTVKSTKK